MRVYPLLLKPRLLSIKNRWVKGTHNRLREIAMLSLSLTLMGGIYYCTISALRDTQRIFGSQPLTPEIPLSMVLTTLSFMLLMSSSVSALGSLFLARDLDLTLSTPIPRWQFIVGRASEVGLSSCWMLAMFGIPSLAAFGRYFEASWHYYVLAPVLCGALLVLPVTAAMLIALVFGWVVPPQRGRDVFLFLFVFSLGMMAVYLNAPETARVASASVTDLTAINRFSRMSSNPLTPTFYCTQALSQLMLGHTGCFFRTFALLTAAGGIILIITTKMFGLLYEQAYAASQSHRGRFRINSRSAQRWSQITLPFFNSAERAIIAKEFKIFSRDISHTVQLGMLLTICFVYLYNFRVLRSPANVEPEVVRLWEAFLMLANVVLSALVVTSICSRFVFPSVSMEGTAFWIVQSSPIAPIDVLRTKFRAFFVPVALIGAVVFISGAMALNAVGPLVLATCIAGVILCYGLVSLGIGMGAVFSQFDWEYSAQLSTSLGAFVFMLFALLMLIVDLIPIGMMFGAYALLPEPPPQTIFTTNLLVIVLSLSLLLVLNRFFSSWALRAGARALSPK